jgi:hypothetical protein
MRVLAVILLLGGLLVGWTGPASADETASSLPPSDRAAIHGVIEGQIGAFRSGDDGTAFGFASPGIQMQFGDAGHFVEMVKRGYAPVYHPRTVSFGALVEIDGQTVQKVRVAGPDGSALALYYMEREADGTWRIGGCMLTVDDSVGA